MTAKKTKTTKPCTPAKPEIAVSYQTDAVKVPPARLKKLVQFVVQAQGYTLAAVDLAIVDGQEMAGLNRRFLRHMGETDVLSFDLSDATRSGLSAQLIVCGDVAAKQGPLRGLTPQHELMLYIVHGLLHLMGFEDTTIRGGAKMHAREDELLSEFGQGPAFYTPKKRPAKTRR